MGSPSVTSNGRFAVDREFECIDLVAWRGLGELFGPPWEVFGPLGTPMELFGLSGRGSENLMNFCEKMTFDF